MIGIHIYNSYRMMITMEPGKLKNEVLMLFDFIRLLNVYNCWHGGVDDHCSVLFVTVRIVRTLIPEK